MIAENPRPILIVSGDFVRTGGMDRANHALASYLARRGELARLVSYRVAEDISRHPNVYWRRVPKPWNSYTLGRPLLDRLGRREAARISAEGGRVVVNGGNCLWGDVNWVHHLNVLDVPKPGGNLSRRLKAGIDYRLHVASERSALRSARVLVTTCERNKHDIQESFGIPEDRIRVVYYGSEPDLFRPAEPSERARLKDRLGLSADREAYAFVGGLGGDRRKGFDTLFEAWTRLGRDPRWNVDLVVVGDGPERPFWQARAREAGLENRVRFLGFLQNTADVFRACEAHVLPSRYEGYSLVSREALCSGLPAFVTETAGIAEQYPADLRELLLIPDPNDAEGLSERLRRWRPIGGSESVRSSLSAFSSSLREWTWDRMAERFLEVLRETEPETRRG